MGYPTYICLLFHRQIVVFEPLTLPDIVKIADGMLEATARRFAANGITLRVTEAVRDEVVRQGWDRAYGARPLRRSITRVVEDPLCDAILRQHVKSGETTVLDVDDKGATVFRRPEELSAPVVEAELNDVVTYQRSPVRSKVDT